MVQVTERSLEDFSRANAEMLCLKLRNLMGTMKASFPVSFFDRYYNDPLDTTVQPQPIITDPVSVCMSHRVV